jgi:hypothetical protein
MPQLHSDLPILTPDPPRKPASERYGGLYYVGIGGLIVLLCLAAWFSVSLWSLRGYLGDVYVLHDPNRTEVDRVNAAWALSRSAQTGQRQYWDDALDRRLPRLARYLMAESLTASATEADPPGYALSVARSEGWPPWLRVLLVCPMAYAGAAGGRFPEEGLEELRRNPDRMVNLWAAYVQAEQPSGNDAAKALLTEEASRGISTSELATQLLAALRAEPEQKGAILHRAELWMRSHHPSAAEVWKGWTLRGDRFVRSD